MCARVCCERVLQVWPFVAISFICEMIAVISVNRSQLLDGSSIYKTVAVMHVAIVVMSAIFGVMYQQSVDKVKRGFVRRREGLASVVTTIASLDAATQQCVTWMSGA